MADSDFAFQMVPLPAYGLFWITFSGEVTAGRLAKAHAEFTRHPDYEPSVDELLDFSDTSINLLSQKDIAQMRVFMRGRPDRHHIRSAIVVGSKVDYGVGRMFGTLVEVDAELPVEYRTCHLIREAVEWLRPGQEDELIAAHAEAGGDVDAAG